jgi:hypothetical protein
LRRSLKEISKIKEVKFEDKEMPNNDPKEADIPRPIQIDMFTVIKSEHKFRSH